MSRGLGHVQRKVLRVLAAEPLLEAREVAARVFGKADPSTITASEASSVRRALAGLQQNREVIDLGPFYVGGRHAYCAREEAFWILHDLYTSIGSARAFWPHGKVALFYGLERRRRRREAIETLRRLKLYRWRHESWGPADWPDNRG